MIPTTRGSLLDQLKGEMSEFAWADFCEAYRPLLVAWAAKASLSKEEAEELLAEIYAHLVPRLRKFTYSPDQRFRGWLKKTVYSAIADYRGRRRRQLGEAQDAKVLEQIVSDADAEDLAGQIDADVRERIAHADAIVARVKGRVSERNWAAFELTYVDGLDCEEAAERLNIGRGQVHVARCRIKAMLSREGQRFMENASDQSTVDKQD